MANSENSLPSSKQHLHNSQPRCPFLGLIPLLSASATYHIFIKSKGEICPLLENFPSQCIMEEPDWNNCKLNAKEFEEKVNAFYNFSVWDGNNKPKGKCFGPPMSFREWEEKVMGKRNSN